MKTMLRLDMIGLALLNTTLRAIGLAGATADALFGNLEAFAFRLCMAHREVGTVDGSYTKVEVFYLGIADDEDDADTASITRIDIHQIRLFLEDDVLPVFLFVIWYGLCHSRQTNHLLELRQRMNLYMPVVHQLPAEILSASRIEINSIWLVVNSRDAPGLGMAVLVNGGECQNADIAEFLDTGFCVHNYSLFTSFQHCGSGA